MLIHKKAQGLGFRTKKKKKKTQVELPVVRKFFNSKEKLGLF